MTYTPDELQRAVERLKKAVVFADGASLVDHEDIDFLLSERAELLATVERMRGALEFYADRKLYAGNDTSHWTAAGDDEGRKARAALTTGEDK